MKITKEEVLSYDKAYHASDDFEVEASAYVEHEEFEGWVEFKFSWDMDRGSMSDMYITYTDIEDPQDDDMQDIQDALEDYISKGNFEELNHLED